MSNPADDAAAEDIAELNRLVSECKRPRVKSMLESYITQLQMQSSSSAPKTAPAPGPPAPVVAPKRLPTIAAPAAPSGDDVKYVPVTAFAWDQDSYGKTPNHVYVYLMTGFEGIGECKDSVSCTFDKQAFDLKVHGFKGKNYRLFKSNLEKAIDVSESKVIVKKNSIKVVLVKIKGTYGYDNWNNLTEKSGALSSQAAKDDPGAGIMDMMKQMYDEGDDNMKKTLGEAMLKSRQDQAMGNLNAGM